MSRWNGLAIGAALAVFGGQSLASEPEGLDGRTGIARSMGGVAVHAIAFDRLVIRPHRKPRAPQPERRTNPEEPRSEVIIAPSEGRTVVVVVRPAARKG